MLIAFSFPRHSGMKRDWRVTQGSGRCAPFTPGYFPCLLRRRKQTQDRGGNHRLKQCDWRCAGPAMQAICVHLRLLRIHPLAHLRRKWLVCAGGGSIGAKKVVGVAFDTGQTRFCFAKVATLKRSLGR